ncbi:MAG: hypothetical protein AAB152_11955 [Candidatus Coatesbacteria bacterium]
MKVFRAPMDRLWGAWTAGALIGCACLSGCALNAHREDYSDAQLVYVSELMAGQPEEFDVEQAAVPAIWARVHTFLAQHSSMNIRTATDDAIETNSPTGRLEYGYSVTRTPAGGRVHIVVRCLGNDRCLWGAYGGDGPSRRVLNAKMLAAYMTTGSLPHPELVSR